MQEPSHRRAANQTVDFRVFEKICKDSFGFILIRDVGGSRGYLDIRESVFDGDSLRRRCSLRPRRAIRDAPFSEVARRLCTDASASPIITTVLPLAESQGG